MANEEVLKEELETEEVKADEVNVDEETVEFDTFTVDLNGRTTEWAVMDEFKFEGKDYLICGEVVGDGISDAGLYIFEGKSEGDELEVRNLDSEEEYTRVAEAYCNLREEQAE